MRRSSTLVLLLGGVFLAACGGEEPAADAGMDAPDVAAAPSDDLACYIARGTMAEAQERPSPMRSLEFSVGGHDGLLCYGSPSARDRTIMGELVPFGEPWRVGANEPTTIHLSGPARVGPVELQPGSYSIYAIPGREEWQIFVNTNWERWGIPIDSAVRTSEVGTFAVEPETTDTHVEAMTFHFEPNAEGTMGDMVMEWENTRVRFHVHPGM